MFTALNDATLITAADVSDADPFFVKIDGGEVGTTLVITLTSDGAEEVVTEEFAVTAAAQAFAITAANAGDYAAGVALALDGKLRDSNNNLSASATAGDTLTTVE